MGLRGGGMTPDVEPRRAPIVTGREIEMAMAVGPCRCPDACLLDTDDGGGCAYCFHARPAYPCPAEVAS